MCVQRAEKFPNVAKAHLSGVLTMNVRTESPYPPHIAVQCLRGQGAALPAVYQKRIIMHIVLDNVLAESLTKYAFL